MILRLSTFAIGAAIGISIVLVLDKAAGTNSAAMPAAPAQTVESVGTTEEAEPTKPEEEPSADAPEPVRNPAQIPSVYRELVGPVPRIRFSLSELHAAFENEPRDETWAVAMEAGIRDHYARFGARENTVLDYVECRSQHCEIAGFVEEGSGGVSGYVYSEMTRSGWWQANGGSHHLGGQADGVDRFVVVISRYSAE